MKKNIALFLLLMVASIFTYAQCDKRLLLTASKTEYLDAAYAIQRTVDEESVIEISKPVITIIPGDGENKMTGTIKSDSCSWKLPYKEGKSVLKTTLADPSGEERDVTITIEGKEGKLTLLMEIDDMPDKKIRVALNKFEEKK